MAGKSGILNKIKAGSHFGFLQLLPWQQQVINWLFYLLQMQPYVNQMLITCIVESRLDSVTKIMGWGWGEGRSSSLDPSTVKHMGQNACFFFLVFT